MNPGQVGPGRVPLSNLIHAVSVHINKRLMVLTDNLQDKDRSDSDRKTALIDFLDLARNHLIKLLIVSKWVKNAGIIGKAEEMNRFLQTQDEYFQTAAATLYQTHAKLQMAKVPVYDVPSAIDILTHGSYLRLPTCIESVIPEDAISATETQETISRLDEVLALRLLATEVPSQFVVKTEGGKATCTVKDEFEVEMTVEGEGLKDPWKILSLKIFVASYTPSTNLSPSEDQTRYLKELLKARLAASETPLVELYKILHTFCLSLSLSILHTQASLLSKLKTNLGNIMAEYSQDSKLSIRYWIKDTKVVGPQEGNRVDVSLDPEKAELVVVHTPSLGPFSFDLVFSRLNAENLIYQAMELFIHQRLQVIFQTLETDGNFIKKHNLQFKMSSVSVNRVKCIQTKLVEDTSLFVGMEIHSGKWTLKIQPPSNQLGEKKLLETMVGQLNRNESDLKEVIERIRIQKTLEYFEQLSYSVELEPYRSLPIKHNRTGHHFGDSTLFLRFPDTFDGYFMVIQVADTPVFYFIQTKKNQSFFDIEVIQSLNLETVSMATRNFSENSDEVSHNIIEKGFPQRKKREMIFAHLSLKRAKITVPSTSNLNEEIQVEPAAFVTAEDFFRLVSTCKKKIGKLMLSKQLDSKKIEFKSLSESSLSFNLNLPPFNLKNIELKFSDSGWEVRLNENETAIFSSHRLPLESSTRNMHIAYCPDISAWQFIIHSLPSENSLEILLQDLKCVSGFVDLREQFQRVAKFQRVFVLESFSPTHAVIMYKADHEGIDQPIHISLGWKQELGFQLFFNSPLLRLFELLINSSSRNMYTFLEHLSRTIQPVHLLQKYLALENSLISPFDFSIVPRSTTQLRLTYRGVFGIDFKFASDDFVILEDAGNVESNGPNQHQFTRVVSFRNWANSLSPSQGTIRWENPTLHVSHMAISEIIQSLHVFLAVLFLFQLLPNDDKGDKENLEATFTNKKITFVLNIVSYSAIELSINDMPAAATNEVLDASEKAILTQYFKEKVINPPYIREYFAAFVKIIRMPLQVIKEFIRMMAYEVQATQGDSPTVAELYLTGHTNHEASTNSVTYLVRLKKRETKETVATVALQYNYEQSKLAAVNMSPTNNPSLSDQIKTKVDQAAGSVIRALENLSQVQFS
eukprot:TRINITY_DN3323_c0_g1_i2.p1 TRINITY_DN3323_c0_g1~~TRINITY_DN3323_c0_g1_i2.p1  ORF type:complete len:1144 (-),score=353.46 TRINITY_DN3323_c0_g1_i2:27-3458(-)